MRGGGSSAPWSQSCSRAPLVPAGPGRQAPLAPRPAQAAAAAGWTTYHYDNARDGNDTAEPAYGAQTGTWTSPTLDGAIYASPLIWSCLVLAATENNTAACPPAPAPSPST